MALKRKCFKCGALGHSRLQCPSPDSTEAGREACRQFRAYKPCRRNQNFSVLQQGRRAQQRIESRLLPFLDDGADPVAFAEAQSKKMATELQTAAWDHLDRGMSIIESELASVPTTSDDQSAHSAEASMTRQLHKAVDSGFHADFTEPSELMAYARTRIHTRARYLYNLLMTHHPICAAVRRRLLPSLQPKPVRVLSIGGGPGFDDVALRLLVGFLQNGGRGIKHREHGTCNGPEISTLVLDLFEKDWACAVSAVSKATKAANMAGLVGDGLGPQLAHCDITLSVDAECGTNTVLAAESPNADLFIFSFVLHENAVGLLRPCTDSDSTVSDHSDVHIGGVLPGLLSTAKLGAVMLCLDAGHRLWPMLAMTARTFGWRAASPDVKRGGRDVLVMQRICADAISVAEWADPGLEQRLNECTRHFEAHVDRRDRLPPWQRAMANGGDICNH